MVKGETTTVEELADAAREVLLEFISERSDTMMIAMSNIAEAMAKQRGMVFPKHDGNEATYGEYLDMWDKEGHADRWQLLEWEAFRYIVEPFISITGDLPGDTEIVLGD